MSGHGPLSRREVLLAVICERHPIPYYPNGYAPWCALLNTHVTTFGGSGDAASLRAMERKGLIKRVPQISEYTYQATEDGLLEFERVIRPKVQE